MKSQHYRGESDWIYILMAFCPRHRVVIVRLCMFIELRLCVRNDFLCPTASGNFWCDKITLPSRQKQNNGCIHGTYGSSITQDPVILAWMDDWLDCRSRLYLTITMDRPTLPNRPWDENFVCSYQINIPVFDIQSLAWMWSRHGTF